MLNSSSLVLNTDDAPNLLSHSLHSLSENANNKIFEIKFTNESFANMTFDYLVLGKKKTCEFKFKEYDEDNLRKIITFASRVGINYTIESSCTSDQVFDQFEYHYFLIENDQLIFESKKQFIKIEFGSSHRFDIELPREGLFLVQLVIEDAVGRFIIAEVILFLINIILASTAQCFHI